MTLHSLFETHLKVTDLQRSKLFYSEILGLEIAHQDVQREVIFFWVGGRGRSMIGLWGGEAPVSQTTHHLALSVDLSDVLDAPKKLNQSGVQALDFFGHPTTLPSVIGWMPAVAIYFLDPDGHLLEYLAMLPDPPSPDAGVVSYPIWSSLRESN